MPPKKVWYKIVEIDDRGRLLTLFHGLDGSRELVRGKWLRADRRIVRKGASRRYESGFHVMPTREAARDYLGQFRHRATKRIVACAARGIRRKRQSRTPVFLADEIFFPIRSR